MLLKFLFTTAVLTTALMGDGTQGYKPGDEVSDFKLKNIDGKMISMADYKDAKGFIVVFTCNHCPYAKAYEQRIIELDKKYKALGWPVLAINSNDVNQNAEDSYEGMQTNAKEKGFTFPYLYDESQEVAKRYGATRTPHVYLVQKEGKKMVVKYIGAIDNNYEDASAVTEKYVESALDALSRGKAPEKQETKAVGCTIKWKK